MRLLVIEDETALSEVIRAAFTDEKFEVDLAEDGETGYLLGSSGMYDAIILDGMLPEMDGYDVLRKWRQGQIHTPVLMLTARSELEDKLKGLGLGADDYLTKPFDMEELVARIRVITRRQGAVQIDYLELEDLRLNLDSGVIVNTETQQEVRLGKKEFQLLELFMRNSGQTLRREQIAEKLWGYDCEAEYNNVEVYISFTRRKLKYIESRVLIKAVRGIGYRLEKRND
ncbi:MAG TPA: response regulator transcription factor [Candidatus Mediterraneibacter vanvlietii]|nr:response regulator transcription factor [Candidatus Mediterraneibacter vanvlietii]